MLPGGQVEPGGALFHDTAVVVKTSSLSWSQHSNQVGALGAIAATSLGTTAELHSFGGMVDNPCKA